RPLRKSNTKRGSCAARRPNLVGGMRVWRRKTSILRISMGDSFFCATALRATRALFPLTPREARGDSMADSSPLKSYLSRKNLTCNRNSSGIGGITMDPRERLTELAAARNASLAALSRMIGRNSSYLQQFVTKGSPRKLEEEDRRKLADFFAVAESELGAPEDRGRPRGEFVDIPRLPLEASAGPGATGAQEIPFDSFRFSRRWLREQGLEPAQLSAIRVMGDSMDPLLRDGDEILVDRSPRPFREGVHVVRLGEALHVKLLQAVPPARLRLISKNPAY